MPLPKIIYQVLALMLLYCGCNNSENKNRAAVKQHAKTQAGIGKSKIIQDADLAMWVKELNNYIAGFDTLSPFRSYLLKTAHLPKVYKDSVMADNASTLDSEIDGTTLIPYAQIHISDLLTRILNHPHISIYDLKQLLDLPVTRSKDGRLYNVTLDEKTGGTYRSQLSWIQYRSPEGKVINIYPQQFSDNGTDNNNDATASLNPDGYGQIWDIETKQGIKYLLAGTVPGCSTCVGNYIDLISYKNGNLNTDFSYSVSTRWSMDDGEGVNDVISYNEKKKRIEVQYHTNDMAPVCSCSTADDSDDTAGEDEGNEDEKYGRLCRCHFAFNGYTFVRKIEKRKR